MYEKLTLCCVILSKYSSSCNYDLYNYHFFYDKSGFILLSFPDFSLITIVFPNSIKARNFFLRKKRKKAKKKKNRKFFRGERRGKKRGKKEQGTKRKDK